LLLLLLLLLLLYDVVWGVGCVRVRVFAGEVSKEGRCSMSSGQSCC
jgi:hypothetical protein